MRNNTSPPPREPTLRDIKEFDARRDRADRLVAGYSDFRSMPIDVHIKWIELVLQGRYIRKVEPFIADYASELIDFYRYFKHTFDAVTVGDVHELLREGHVESRTVRLWIKDGLIVDAVEHTPVYQGYPDLREELSQAEPGKILRAAGIIFGEGPART